MYTLCHGDCLDVMPTLEAGSVDAIICDPPYGTTACDWDIVIPFEPMWREIKRVLKPRGACVLFGSEPFASHLRLSNLPWYKYDWVWDKVNRYTGWLDVNRRPLRCHELIMLFADGQTTYNRQFRKKAPYTSTRIHNAGQHLGKNEATRTTRNDGNHNPCSIISIEGDNKNEHGLHPTQKPIALMRYLVRTYTNVGETVLDFTMGSGTTGEACILERRSFIGIEKDPAYFAIAEKRITTAANNRQMTLEELL